MKRLLLALAAFASLPLAAQSVPCNLAGSLTAVGDSIILDNTRLGCYEWRVAYTSTGFTGISISLQTATTFGGSFSDFTGSAVVIDGSNPSTATTHAIIGIHSNGAFIKLHLGTATGTGTLIYQVWGANSTTTASSLITGTTPIVVAGNNVSCPTCGTSSGTVTAVTATAPLTSSGGTAPVISATYQGNGAKIQASTGTTTKNVCVKFDSNGNTVDAGSACGTGGGSGFTTQNVLTGSRTLNTVFQNTSGKTMFVRAVVNWGTNTGNLNSFSDSSNPPTQTVDSVSASGLTQSGFAVTNCFMVLNNNFYQVQAATGASLILWVEWN